MSSTDQVLEFIKRESEKKYDFLNKVFADSENEKLEERIAVLENNNEKILEMLKKILEKK